MIVPPTTSKRASATTRGLLPNLLAAATVQWLGVGLLLAFMSLYFVTVIGLSAVQVGFGLAVAGGAAIVFAPLVGALGDRVGLKRVLVATTTARAAVTASGLLVQDWWGFLVFSVLLAVTDQAGGALLQAMVGGSVPPERRNRVLAAHRIALNIGISAGGLLATLVFPIGGFVALFLADAVLTLVAVPFLLRIRSVRLPTSPGARSSAWAPFSDHRLVALTLYDGVITLWQPLLNIGFPLWLASTGAVPVELIGVLYAVNTTLCIALQLPVSLLASSPRRALGLYAAACGALAFAALAFAAVPGAPGAAVVAVFAAAIVLLTLGELAGAGAAWTLSFALAPDDQQAAYLAAFGAGRTISTRIVGPLLVTAIVLPLGTFGWSAVAVLFALSALPPLLLAARIRPTAASAQLEA